MNKYHNSRILVIIFLIILLSFSTNAYTPTWKVDFTNTLSNYSDHFTAGAGSPATDSYNSIDLRHPPPPPSAHIQMYTLVDETSLTLDYRADLEIGTPKTWQIKLVAADPLYQGVSGSNTIIRSLENTDNLNLQLIDYGSDNSRTNIVDTINLKQESSYEFSVNNALGPYRYLDLVVEKTSSQQEEQPPSQPATQDGGTRSSCAPSWICTDWTECSPTGAQTRTCADKNDCGTTRNKPSEQRTCAYTTPKPIVKELEEKIEEETTTIEKESAQKTTITTIQETKKKEPGLTEITGAVVGPPAEAFIGILIIIIIVGVGLTIFYFVTKK